MPVTLPQEIIDAIIDDVALIQNVEPLAPFSAGNSVSAELCACALTSTTFLPRARRHIFRQILLFPHEDLQRIAPFSFNPGRPRRAPKSSISARFMEQIQPSTAALVESLVLVGSFGPGGTDLEDWASRDPDFRRVVISLTSLHSLTLRRFMIHSLHANTLHSILPNLVIRSIIFAGVHMQNGAMPPFFLLFPHMASVEILPAPTHDKSWANTIFWIPRPGAHTAQDSLLPRPQSLTLRDIDGGELSRLVKHPWPLQLDHIRHLKCSFSWYGTQQLTSLSALMANMSALAHLSLGFQDTDYTIDRFPFLPFYCLTSLALSVSLASDTYDEIRFGTMAVSSPWNLYVRSLTMPDHIYYLEDFQLSLRFTHSMVVNTTGAWGDLPSALIRFPTLSRVTFVVDGDTPDEGLRGECRALYHSLVAALVEEDDVFNSLLGHADVTVKLDGGKDRQMNTSICYPRRED